MYSIQNTDLTYGAGDIKRDIPDLSDMADKLIDTLQKARTFMEKLFQLCLEENQSIDLIPEEEQQITSKIALIREPEKSQQYARLVQLIFQFNYYANCFKKAKKFTLSKENKRNLLSILKKIEKYRKLIEKKYLLST